MGKYKGVTFTKQSFQEVLLDNLLHIANELAEQNDLLKKANKLKRLELELKVYEGEIKNTPKNLEDFDKDLRDLAP